MKRFASLTLIGLIVLGGGAAATLGYFTHREQLAPAYSVAERMIRKLRREIGMPSETEVRVQRIETTSLTLHGTTYVRKDNDFRVGGGLSLWGDDVLMINQHGTIYYLDEDDGLIATTIGTPETGKAAYIKLAAEEYPDQMTSYAGVWVMA